MVVLTDENNKPLVRFLSNGIIEKVTEDNIENIFKINKPTGDTLGKITIMNGSVWLFKSSSGLIMESKHSIFDPDSVLKFEVDLSKHFIQTLKATKDGG